MLFGIAGFSFLTRCLFACGSQVLYVLVADFLPYGRKIGNKKMAATALPKALTALRLSRLARNTP